MSAGLKFTATKDGRVLKPWGVAAVTDFERVPQNKLVMVEITQRRNPAHHARWWAICQKVAETSPGFDDAENVAEFVKIRLRMVASYKDWDGRIVIRTKSISYASMDQLSFSRFYDRGIFILSEYLGFDVETLLDDDHRVAA